ncbi:MAG: DUF1738 domain-containing protein [Hydrococcus sp. SU_1_0]|nr:DUF1738 domain-containing protein [Hydrococcus sp. SU_1_0]
MAAKKKSRTKISKNFTTVTNKLLELIERGIVPWHQSWHNIGYQNLISKKPYSGINPILCQIDCLYYGYSSPYYIGKAQCSQKGWKIKQGSKANWLRWGGSKIISEQITDEQGQTQEREKFIRSFKWLMVFNTEAIDDSQSESKIADLLPQLAQELDPVKDVKIESFIANLNVDIKYGGNQASHNFTTGQIQMPYQGQFTSKDVFWATLFHELVHSTAKKLQRPYTTYAPAATQIQGYASSTQGYTPVPVLAQKSTPMLNQVSKQTRIVEPPKALTEAQIVFTIINSEISKFKRQGQNVEAKAIKLAYQQYYAGWNKQQILQAAFALVEMYDQHTGQWRLIVNEQELRNKQVQFSKRYHYFKNRRAAA